MLIGQGRAGKTALANNMMGKGFIRDTNSTIGIEKFERKILYGGFKNGTSNGLKSGLKEYANPPKHLEEAIAIQKSKEMIEIEKGKTSPVSKSSPLSHSPLNSFNPSSFSEMMNHETYELKGNLEADSLVDSKNDFSMTQKTIDLLAFDRSISENIKDPAKLIISLYDFGGQDVFNAIHSLFMSKSAVYLVVFDMELLLSKDILKQQLCLQNLKFWLNSLFVHTYNPNLGKVTPFAIVGTRRDKFRFRADHLKISNLLRDKFHDFFDKFGESLISFSYEEKGLFDWSKSAEDQLKVLPFFPIDNKKGLKSETLLQLLEKIQKSIEDGPYYRREVSTSWLSMIDAMKDLQRPYLFRREIVNLSYEHGIFGEEELNDFLSFLVDFGLIYWIKEDSLEEIIIIDPVNYVVKPVTTIICKHIAFRSDPYKTVHHELIHRQAKAKFNRDWDQMLEFGIVSENLANELIGFHFKESFHVAIILHLMKKFGLMVPIVIDHSLAPTVKIEANVPNTPHTSIATTQKPRFPLLTAIYKFFWEQEESSSTQIAENSLEVPSEMYYLFPALLPSNPAFYHYSNSDKSIAKLLNRLTSRFAFLSRPFLNAEVLYFTTIFGKAEPHHLYSLLEIEQEAFLPNGLYEKLLGSILEDIFIPSNKDSGSSIIMQNNLFVFKEGISFTYNNLEIRLSVGYEHNLVQMEVCKIEDGQEENGQSSLKQLHHHFEKKLARILKESYDHFQLLTLIPCVDIEKEKDSNWKTLILYHGTESRISLNEFLQENTCFLPLQKLPRSNEFAASMKNIPLISRSGKSVILSTAMLIALNSVWSGCTSSENITNAAATHRTKSIKSIGKNKSIKLDQTYARSKSTKEEFLLPRSKSVKPVLQRNSSISNPGLLVRGKTVKLPENDVSEEIKEKFDDDQSQSCSDDEGSTEEFSGEYHCFLSHDWGENNQNHNRVRQINRALKQRGLVTWFDEEQLSNDVKDTIVRGINNSRCVLIFITDNYRNKVNHKDPRDFCKFEFRLSFDQKGPEKMIPIVMEACMRNPREWRDELGGNLSGLLYKDMSDIPDENHPEFEKFIDNLYSTILSM